MERDTPRDENVSDKTSGEGRRTKLKFKRKKIRSRNRKTDSR